MNNLLFDFKVDKAAQTVFVDRQFDAGIELVWDAFTKQEILDQWWAPKPWLSRTKVMNFEVGGQRFYAMVGPEGQESWSVQRYTSISPKTNFKFMSAFSDKEGKEDLPGSDWDLTFSENDGITTVNIVIWNESAERMEQMLEMGFQGGFTMTLNELGNLLARQKEQA